MSKRPVLRKRSRLLVCLLLLAAVGASGAQEVGRQDRAADPRAERSGNWSATAGGGRTLMGTWTAVPDSSSGALTGTWTLVDAQGRTVASGLWSAAKSPARWNGAWRAVISGREGEYAGTWNARLDLEGNSRLADLLESAVRTAVSGTWRSGPRSGAWSVRTAARPEAP